MALVALVLVLVRCLLGDSGEAALLWPLCLCLMLLVLRTSHSEVGLLWPLSLCLSYTFASSSEDLTL